MYLVGFVYVVIALFLFLAIRVTASELNERETVKLTNIGILALLPLLMVSLTV